MLLATRRRWGALSLALVLSLSCFAAAAEEPIAPPPDPTRGDCSDARIEEPDPRQGALQFPRLVLLPLKLVFTGLSYPFRWLANFYESDHVAAFIVDATTFSDGKRSVRPTFDYSSRYAGSGGLTYLDNKTLGPRSTLRADFAIGGVKVIMASIVVRPNPDNARAQFDLQLRYRRRNEDFFDGAGNEPRRESRYEINAVSALAMEHVRLSKQWMLDVGSEGALKHFQDGEAFDGNPPISQAYCRRIFGRCIPGTVDESEVPGFTYGAQFLRAGAEVRYDSNSGRVEPHSGFSAAGGADYSHGYGHDYSSYVRIHGNAAVYINMWRGTHVLVLSGRAALIEPTNDVAVPFSELPVLGGPNAMRGFREGSLRDESLMI